MLYQHFRQQHSRILSARWKMPSMLNIQFHVRRTAFDNQVLKFPHHYLILILNHDIASITMRWQGLQKEEHYNKKQKQTRWWKKHKQKDISRKVEKLQKRNKKVHLSFDSLNRVYMCNFKWLAGWLTSNNISNIEKKQTDTKTLTHTQPPIIIFIATINIFK